MKFYPVASELSAEVLHAGYKEGREIGKVRLGGQCLYFRDKLKVYYIPYADMTGIQDDQEKERLLALWKY